MNNNNIKAGDIVRLTDPISNGEKKLDVVIDPTAGSASSLRAAANCGRSAYGFEIKKNFFKIANEKMLRLTEPKLF